MAGQSSQPAEPFNGQSANFVYGWMKTLIKKCWGKGQDANYASWALYQELQRGVSFWF